MSSETAYFLSQDGLKLYYRHWDVSEPRAMLCIIHGLGEHSNRYQHFAHHLTQHGITVFALDLRGHGLSQGKKGHARSYALLMSDIEELLKTARAEYTDLPMYLLGQSMGGNLVANYTITMNTNELAGYILTAPWFRLSFEPPKWKVQLAGLVNKFFPSITQPNDLNPEDLSRDPEIVKAYKEDPLVHRVISAGLYTACAEAGATALNRASELKLRGLILQGNADPIIDYKATEEFANKAQNTSWFELKDVLHEPLNDLGKDTVTELIKDWIYL